MVLWNSSLFKNTEGNHLAMIPFPLQFTEVFRSARLLLLWPAFFPEIQTCVIGPEKSAPFPPVWRVTPRRSGCPMVLSRGSLPLKILYGRSTLQKFVWSALLPSFEDKMFRACTLLNFRKVFQSRGFVIIFPPLGSTFQRTPFGGWRLSVSFGFPLLAGFGSSDNRVSPLDLFLVPLKSRFQDHYLRSCLLSLTWYIKANTKNNACQVFEVNLS